MKTRWGATLLAVSMVALPVWAQEGDNVGTSNINTVEALGGGEQDVAPETTTTTATQKKAHRKGLKKHARKAHKAKKKMHKKGAR